MEGAPRTFLLAVLALAETAAALCAQDLPPPVHSARAVEQSHEADATPIPAVPLVLTLDQAIDTCLRADPKLHAGYQAVRQANADALSASLLPNPQLFTDGQLLPFNGSFTPTTQGGPTQQDANLIYPVDWFLFGKRMAAMAGAEASVRISEAEYADLVRQRVLETAVAFFDVVEANTLLEIAQQDVQGLDDALRKAKHEGGNTELELNRVRLSLLSSRRSQRDAESAVVTSMAHLRSILGEVIGIPRFDAMSSLDKPRFVNPIPVEDAFALALQFRPDIAALRTKVDQARTNAITERRKAYPAVAAQLGYTHQYQQSLGFPDANSWNAAVTMSLPFFDRNQGNCSKASSVILQTQEELRLAEAQLRAELETSINELRTARINADSVAQEQLELAAAVRDSMNQSYETGKCPLSDMLDAQRVYRDTLRLFISSRADYWRAAYKFDAAIGQQMTR